MRHEITTAQVTRLAAGGARSLRSATEMSRSRRQLETRIERIKREIAKLDRIHPGTLSQQYNVCGNAHCRCKADPPQKHGPYHQVSFTWRGKNSSRFVRRDDVARVKRELKNYQRLRELMDEWVELTIDLAKLEKAGQAA